MRFGHEALSQQPASGAPSRAGALHVAVTAPEAELLTPGCVLEGTEAIARVVAGARRQGISIQLAADQATRPMAGFVRCQVLLCAKFGADDATLTG